MDFFYLSRLIECIFSSFLLWSVLPGTWKNLNAPPTGDRRMHKTKLVVLKNQMLVANCVADFIGFLLVSLLMSNIQEASAREILAYPVAKWIAVSFNPFAFSFVGIMTIIYEIPIRQNASSSAARILDAVFDTVYIYIGEVKIEDDITSVIVKM